MKKLLSIFCATVMVGCSNDEQIDSVSEEFDENGIAVVTLSDGKINGDMVVGHIYAWTDMTSEHGEDGKQIIEKLGQYMIPKCLDEKAQVIRVELKSVR